MRNPKKKVLYSLLNNSGDGLDDILNRFSFHAELKSSLILSRGTGNPTFTRATTATVWDHEPLLKTVLSGEARFTGARRVHNRVVNSGTLTAAAGWTVSNATSVVGASDPKGGTLAYTFTATGATAQIYRQSVGITASDTQTASFYARRVSGSGTVELISDGSASNLAITLTSAWQRFSRTATPVSGSYIGIQVNTSGDVIEIYGPQPEAVTGQAVTAPSEYIDSATDHGAGVVGVKYFQTTNGNTVASNVVTEATGSAITDATLKGYLAEGARTNLVLQSQAQGTNPPWSGFTGATPTNNIYVAPDGTTTMSRLAATAGAGAHFNRQPGITVSAAVYTRSAYLRYVNNRWVGLNCYDGVTTFFASFDLLNGVVGSKSAGVTSSSIEATGITGVYRATMTFTAAASAAFLVDHWIEDADYNAPTNYVAAGTELVGIWGDQVELGAFASSYIPTTTAAVTRNADVLTYPTSGNLADAAGTCYAEVTTLQSGGLAVGSMVCVSANDGSGGVPLGFGLNLVGLYDSAAWREVATTLSLPITTHKKMASSWNSSIANAYCGAIGGALLGYDGNPNFGATIYIALNGGPSGHLWGNIRNAHIAQSALTSTQLIQLTR